MEEDKKEKRIVVVGGGPGPLLARPELRKLLEENPDIVLATPDEGVPMGGMGELPQFNDPPTPILEEPLSVVPRSYIEGEKSGKEKRRERRKKKRKKNRRY